MNDYRNDYLDRVIAVMVFIVFLVALGYSISIIAQFWHFFRWFFCGMVVGLCVWIVSMLFNIIWRYNAKTQAILTNSNIPLQLSQKTRPAIYDYSTQETDYNDYFADDDDDD